MQEYIKHLDFKEEVIRHNKKMGLNKTQIAMQMQIAITQITKIQIMKVMQMQIKIWAEVRNQGQI